MATREELKEQLYDAFYKEECSLLNKPGIEDDAKPCIWHTQHYAKESKIVIPFLVVSKLFPKRANYRRSKAAAGITIGTIIVLILLFDDTGSFLSRIVLSAIGALMVYGITIEQLVRVVPGNHIEISSEGIKLKDRNFTWDQIMGTYIVFRRYKMQLVLLLDDGEILRQELENYGKFSFRRGKQISEICHCIEHFKNKAPGW
jgi:hypothetical protein